MTQKVRVAIFDGNLRAEIKKYELTDDGNQIRILKGGKKHFYPDFNESSYLDIKKRRLLGGGYTRIYFVRRNASKCVDFKTESVGSVDPKQVIDAASSELIKNFGKEEKGVPWYIWVLFLILIGIALRVFGVIV